MKQSLSRWYNNFIAWLAVWLYGNNRPFARAKAECIVEDWLKYASYILFFGIIIFFLYYYYPYERFFNFLYEYRRYSF